jgi:hypothetical protein
MLSFVGLVFLTLGIFGVHFHSKTSLFTGFNDLVSILILLTELEGKSDKSECDFEALLDSDFGFPLYFAYPNISRMTDTTTTKLRKIPEIIVVPKDSL